MGKRKSAEKRSSSSKDIVEYHCSVFFQYNKLKRQQEYCIRLETAKFFSSMNFRLTAEVRKKKREIDINITGLTPDQIYTTSVQPAACDLLFDELYGEYSINVIKREGTVNSAVFNFNIFKKEISLVKAVAVNNKIFCTFQTADDLNTFS